MFKLISLIGVVILISNTFAQQAQQCYTPDNYPGRCKRLANCRYLSDLYAQNYNSPQLQQFIAGAQVNCGSRTVRGDPVVCCSNAYNQGRGNRRQGQSGNRITSPRKNPLVSRTGTCTNPNGVGGVCVPLGNCQEFVERYTYDSSFAGFLRASNRVCGQPAPIICCPSQSPAVVQPAVQQPNVVVNRLPTIAEGCGTSSSVFRKVVGGEPAKLGAWPWIALLGYRDSFGTSSFKCGGTLITQKHVLTAAHCIRPDLFLVRLGEHNLNSDRETRHVDINVVRMAKHPNYTPKDGHNDIAVVTLASAAPNTKLIHPACLPINSDLRSKSFVGYSPFVAGWGKTQEGGSSASVLQELQIPILQNAVCRDRYQQKNRLVSSQQFDNAVICAGVLAGGKDTCQGDSGGPLMIPIPSGQTIHFYVIGVVSYGIGCARPEVPGVYSNVPVFIDWIQQQVAA